MVRNSHVVAQSSRADMVEKFLSLREHPLERKESSHELVEGESIISEESYGETSYSGSIRYTGSPLKKDRKKLKRVGSYLRSASVKSSFRIASQNIGLMRESVIKSHLEHEEVIGNFDRLRKLGEGAFATVYLVRRKRSSLLLALKAIDKVRVAEEGLRGYVYAERQVFTQINHPFILHAQLCLQDFGHLYILTEFCSGGDLQKVVRESPLEERMVRTYLCEAALGL